MTYHIHAPIKSNSVPINGYVLIDKYGKDMLKQSQVEN